MKKGDNKPLPRLIKGSSTYKLVIPAKVEEKIRYLQRKYPSTEWSGVLFTTHEGNFEDNNLVITCQDIYPMDLGNATFTEYSMDETVAGYIAENIELFSCDLGLVHSHHTMSTFFSGTDTNTLREEGNERNCFVSLIVNNAGTYNAAVTRKIQTKTEVVKKSLGTSYQFFGEGAVKTDEDPMTETTEIVDDEVIEYFMLDIEKEEVNNPLDYLDARFAEIEKRKAEAPKQWSIPQWKDGSTSVQKNWWDRNEPEKELDFNTYLNKTKTQEPFLFKEDETYGAEDVETVWESNEEEIHKCVVQMITCSFIVDSKKIDLKQWVTRHMANKYKEIFIEPELFDNWCDFVVDFVLDRYYQQYGILSANDVDVFIACTAGAIRDELEQYAGISGVDSYISGYIDALERHIFN